MIKHLIFTLVAVLCSAPASAYASAPALSGNPVVDGILSTILYGAIGVIFGAVSFRVIDATTPGDLKQQLTQEKNVALAIVVGAQALGIAIIIAAAIAG